MGIELPRYAVIDGAMGTELTNLGHAKINVRRQYHCYAIEFFNCGVSSRAIILLMC